MDALTLSMNRLGTTPGLVSLAARAIADGIIANSVMKLGIILTIGKAGYRRLAALGLGTLMLATVLTLALFW
ncbi:MAG: hypothetical protein ACT4P6_23575 [Gemmatimonadaceae bacterium]